MDTDRQEIGVGHRQLSVRTSLIGLVLACLLPGILGAGLLFFNEYQNGRAQLEKDNIQTARALVQTVDAYLAQAQNIAQLLATSGSLSRGDIRGFYRRAREMVAASGVGSNVVLTDATGQQVINTLKDFGEALPRHGDQEIFGRVLTTGKPVISDIFIGAVTRRPLMSIDVPVVIGDKVHYVLSIGIMPDKFSNILRTQRLPENKVAAIFDTTGTIVARTHAPEKFVGQKGTEEFIRRIQESGEGTMETVTREGIPTLSVYSRSPVTGWSVGIGMPRQDLTAELEHTLVTLAAGVAALFVLGLGLAWFMSRRVSNSVSSLKGLAVALSRGETVRSGSFLVREMDDVAQAMVVAAEEKRSADERVRRSQEMLQLITDAAPALISYVDTGYRYRFANRTYERWFGIAPEVMIDQPAREVLGDTAWDKVHPWMARALAGETVDYEQELPYREGGSRWVKATYTPDVAEDGTVRGIAILVNDISARVVAEVALREREQTLRAVIDNSPSALSLKRPDGRYALANPNLQHIHELPEGEIVGKTDFDLYPEETARSFRANDALLLDTRSRQAMEEVVPVKGEVRIYMSHMFPIFDLEGNIEYICRISLDITDRKRAEAGLEAQRQRFAGIVESAMDAIISIDAEQRIVLFNTAAEAMFGCPQAQALGQTVEHFLPARFRSAHAAHVERFGAVGTTSRVMGHLGQVYGLRADGGEFPIEASISKIEVAGEKLYTVILRDISDRLAAEAEIRRFNSELEHLVEIRTVELQAANAELESFASTVAHDLRAPLRHMVAFTQMLASKYGDQLGESGRPYFDRIAAAGRQMSDLIDGLLQLSRSTRGDFLRQCINLSDLARQIVGELAAGEPDRTVRYDIEDGLMAEGDPRLLQALMRNLLSNAWKYTGQVPEPVVRFYADRQSGPPRFCVSDNGIGFDMKHADQLFEPFRRLHSPSEFPGIGIGLATVQRIVRRHGGEISAQAAPGQGANFCFTLAPKVGTK